MRENTHPVPRKPLFQHLPARTRVKTQLRPVPTGDPESTPDLTERTARCDTLTHLAAGCYLPYFEHLLLKVNKLKKKKKKRKKKAHSSIFRHRYTNTYTHTHLPKTTSLDSSDFRWMM